jgi:cytochrome c556
MTPARGGERRESIMRRAIVVASIVGAVAATVASCAPRKSRPGDNEAASGERPYARHWIYDDDLRTAMREIERLSGAAHGVELADDPAPLTAEFQRAQGFASRLAASAEALPDAMDRIRLTSDDREAFLEQARALQKQAQNLSRAAGERRPADMQRLLDAITTTCISCHTRFRDFTGELAPPRA